MQSNFDLAPEQWARLRRLLDEALDLPVGERDRWIERLGADDAAFKPRLRALLAHAAGTSVDRLLQTLPKIETDAFAGRPADSDEASEPGQRVGPYRLLRQIGEGGMASVWLAERTDLLQGRRVALKLPHGAWRGAAWAARLEREREILATLAHPNIARLYDAGVSDSGQPYLALEYVEGRCIDVHCRERALALQERLRLFLQVARAVAHAHAKLVVHRDLKPSNILVTADGDVRLLDFGIAKLLEAGAQQTALTQQGGAALTPEYASPEQISGQAIGTASDIYSLGVVLHELLSGQRPYKVARQSRAALEEAVLHAEPARPSNMVAQRQQRKALRGDLDAIVLKALKKQPEQRYGTVEALADDIQRHLDQLPVMARPDSKAYRVRKFAARNRLAAGAAAAVLAAVTLGGGIAVWQAHTAREEQQKAEEVKQFLASILSEADPWESRGKSSSVAELLQQARQQIDAKFAARPPLQVELLNIVGMGLLHHRDLAGAQAALQQAARTADQHLAPDHPQRLRARIYIAELHLERGQPAMARSELTLVLPALRAGGGDPADLVTALSDLCTAAINEGRYDDAVATAEEGDRHARSRLGERHPLTAGVAVTLGLAHLYAGHHDLALQAAERGHRLTYAVYGHAAKRPQTIEATDVYARALAGVGRLQPGVEMLERALSDAAELAGPSSLVVGLLKWKLASLQVRFGQIRQALVHSDDGLRLIAQYDGPNSIRHARALGVRGSALLAARDPRAAGVLSDALRRLEPALGADSAETLGVRTRLALALVYSGKALEAQALLQPTVDRLRGRAHPALGGLLHVLGIAKRTAGEHQAALSLQHEALAALGTHAGVAVERARVLVELGVTRLALGRHEETRSGLQSALDIFRAQQATTTPEAADALLALGRAKLAAGTAAAAEPLLREADQFWRAFDPHSRWAAEAAHWLSRCHAALGRHRDP